MRVKAIGALMALAVGSAAPALGVEPDMVDAAKSIQTACVARGEDSRVCACGVGLAYAKLDPKVFKLMPKLEPLMAQKDKTAQMVGLLSIASQSGLNVADLQSAYETIRANRATINDVCKPIAGKTPVRRKTG